MTLKLSFLAVGNADCIVALPESRGAVLVDIGDVARLEAELAARAIKHIGVIYVTHEHRDHMPTIFDLRAFLESWQALGGTVSLVRLPSNARVIWSTDYKSFVSKGETRKAARVKAALEWLLDAHRRRVPAIRGPGEGESYRDQDLLIDVLHPSYMSEAQVDPSPSPNESSMVLRLSFGRFAAMLLGDLDGQGLEECLIRGKTDATALRAHVVKVPHHGAWPRSGGSAQNLVALLKLIQPQLAVLSVGSQNPYGHVRPELFSCLLDLKKHTGLSFICTEATQTCVLPLPLRTSAAKKGLPTRQLCAGDITIEADANGKFQITTSEPDHAAKVGTIPFAVCAGRASLPP